MSAPIIYACTPFANNGKEPLVTSNVEFAREVCHAIVLAGGVPYAPHLIFPQFLDDKVAVERELGIACGLRMMEAGATELWAVLPPWRVMLSLGMKAEVEAATRLGLPVRTAAGFAGLNGLLERLRAAV